MVFADDDYVVAILIADDDIGNDADSAVFAPGVPAVSVQTVRVYNVWFVIINVIKCNT